MVASEQLYAKYRDSVNFIIVYTAEAWPVGSASPFSSSGEEIVQPESSYDWNSKPIKQAKTYEERLATAKQFIKEEQITLPVIVDEMDNAVWCTYGPASNMAYLMNMEGTILAKQLYYDPEKMATAIEKYLQSNSK